MKNLLRLFLIATVTVVSLQAAAGEALKTGVYSSGDLFGAGAISVSETAPGQKQVQLGFIDNNGHARLWPVKNLKINTEKSSISFDAISGLEGAEYEYQPVSGEIHPGKLSVVWKIGTKSIKAEYKYAGKSLEVQGGADEKPKKL